MKVSWPVLIFVQLGGGVTGRRGHREAGSLGGVSSSEEHVCKNNRCFLVCLQMILSSLAQSHSHEINS